MYLCNPKHSNTTRGNAKECVLRGAEHLTISSSHATALRLNTAATPPMVLHHLHCALPLFYDDPLKKGGKKPENWDLSYRVAEEPKRQQREANCIFDEVARDSQREASVN